MAIAITKRLIIEEATINDASFFYYLLTSPTWIQYIGDRGIIIKLDAITYIEERLVKSYQNHGYGLYKVSIRETNEPIGVCGFLKRDYLDSADIGYALLPEFEGKGYMLEATQAVVEFGREQLGLAPIYAFIDPGNNKSRRLLMKVGMKELKTFQPPDFDHPCVLFSD